MTEDEKAEMFYKECMDNAGITNYPSLEEAEEIESHMEFLSMIDS